MVLECFLAFTFENFDTLNVTEDIVYCHGKKHPRPYRNRCIGQALEAQRFFVRQTLFLLKLQGASPLNLVERCATFFRNFMSRELFKVIERYSRGKVLDVGGRYFYRYVSDKKLRIESWINLDVDPGRIDKINDNVYQSLVCDGCNLCFSNNTFDVVINSQVLEHDMNPLRMVKEIARVLKPNGQAIFLIPQTASIHCIPRCYYNFTIYWIREALRQCEMEVVETYFMGGTWTTITYKMLYAHLQALRVNGWSSSEYKRNFAFYLLYPLMVLYTALSLPILAVLRLGDLKEDANNHLVVAKKTRQPMTSPRF